MRMPMSPTEAISPQLGSGERLLWSGQPRQGVFLRSNDWALIPFSLLWGGFAIFWEWSVVNSNAPLLFRAWGIPFVLIGLYLIVGRFFVDAKQRSNTYYGLTSERVIIVSGLFATTTKSLQLRTLTDVSLVESNNGTGTITFGATPPWWAGGAGWPVARAQLSPAFDTVDSARDVYERLRRAQQAA